jgi:glucose/arabinose dehydrogenase
MQRRVEAMRYERRCIFERNAMRSLFLCSALALAACNGDGTTAAPPAPDRPFTVTPVAAFDEPWAMTFLPGGGLLVTEKAGRLLLVSADDKIKRPISGVPKVAHGGQGGLADVVMHPDYANNGFVYLSYAEAGPGGAGAAVARAKLVTEGEAPQLDGLQVIWRQEPKVSGTGHYSGRMAFSPDGYLFITSGERQKFTPAQDMAQNLGKVIRLSDAGGIPSTNPYYDTTRIKAQIWSAGHRNLLGIAFDGQGRLWADEMGPQGGDELNLIEKGGNYGWPIVSNGDHYDVRNIPDHATRPEFKPPAVTWNPVISPSSLIFYSGAMFPAWRGSALIGGLSSEALVRVTFDGTKAREAERFPMGRRIREVEQGPDGAVWLLEDGEGGRLLKLTPKRFKTAGL